MKFHGMYLQDDRDLRPERTRKKMEKAFAFMIRVRIPGGVLTPQQWLALDRVARDYGNGTMRLTTRQTVQLHGVIKSNLKATLKAIDTVLLNTIAACGDVNRNVMCNRAAGAVARACGSDRTGARRSPTICCRTRRPIARSGSTASGSRAARAEAVEPIYGKTYLPRKFKIVVAVPPSNDVDIFAHDLGYIAITDAAGDIAGWNVTVGGGMGMTHGEPDTYPRTADVMGFCRTEDVVDGGRGGRHRAARLGRPHEPQARAPQIHDRGPRARCVPRRGREALRRQARRRRNPTRSLRPATAMAGPKATTAAGISLCSCRTAACTTFLAPRSRAHCAPSRDARRRFPPHAEPESDHCQCADGEAGRDRAHRARSWPARALVGPAAQFDGLRRAADLRARAGRERALSAGAARRARSERLQRTGCRPTTSSSA